MNINELKIMAKDIAKEYWGLEFDVPVKENGRLTRALGRMCFQRSRITGKITPTKLEVASRLLRNYNDNTIVEVLKHELCHWALAIQGKPFSDGHPVFENELKRIGAPSTNTIQIAGTIYTVCCSKCKKEAASNNSQGKLRKYVLGTSRKDYSSRCCGAKLEWGPTKYIEDANVGVDNSQSRESQRLQRRRLAERAASMQTAEVEVPKQTEQKTAVIRPNAKLGEILIPGPRGVTNKQMIPAIMKAIDLRNTSLLKELAEQYPDVYMSSKKYLNRTYKAEYETLIG